tara:strand:+ start:967 stop:1401 length:435 start_codon:yes stop_codon:yes gene_type:complete
VIAELAAANAAFSILKKGLANGKELFDLADSASTFFDSKSSIAKKAKKGGSKAELENFMALEKIKADEEWLREWMIYAGRADLHGDWLRFQSECRKNRDRAARIKARRRAENIALLWSALLWGSGGLVLLPIIIYLFLLAFDVV